VLALVARMGEGKKGPRRFAPLVIRMVQHVFAEIALAAVGARVGIAALGVAVLAAGDVFRRARLDVIGTAKCIVVVATCCEHRRLSALEAPPEQRCGEQQSDAESCGVGSHAKIHSISIAIAGLDPAIHQKQGRNANGVRAQARPDDKLRASSR
jgi:hypothetical protein